MLLRRALGITGEKPLKIKIRALWNGSCVWSMMKRRGLVTSMNPVIATMHIGYALSLAKVGNFIVITKMVVI